MNKLNGTEAIRIIARALREVNGRDSESFGRQTRLGERWTIRVVVYIDFPHSVLCIISRDRAVPYERY